MELRFDMGKPPAFCPEANKEDNPVLEPLTGKGVAAMTFFEVDWSEVCILALPIPWRGENKVLGAVLVGECDDNDDDDVITGADDDFKYFCSIFSRSTSSLPL